MTINLIFIIVALLYRCHGFDIHVDWGEDSVPRGNSCYPYSNGFCNLRSAIFSCQELVYPSVCTLLFNETAKVNTIQAAYLGPISFSDIQLSIVGNNTQFQFEDIGIYDYPGLLFNYTFSSQMASFSMIDIKVSGFVNNKFDKFLGAYYSSYENAPLEDFIDSTVISLVGDIDFLSLHCQFFNNQGSSGVIFASNNQQGSIYIAHSVFQNNSGSNGGALTFDKNNSNISIINTTFTDCYAKYAGGAIFIKSYNHGVQILGSRFVNCSSDSRGGAIVLFDYNSDLKINSCEFNKASSNYGGSIFISSFNKDLEISDSLFVDSSALYDGGSIFIFNNISNTSIHRCEFIRSSAQYGGSIEILSYTKGIEIIGSLFVDSFAESVGGSIFVEKYNHDVLLTNNTFVQSFAADYGDAIHVYDYNYNMTISNIYFKDCWQNLLNFNAFNHMLKIFNITIVNMNFDPQNSYAAIDIGDFHQDVVLSNCMFINSNYVAAVSIYKSNRNVVVRNIQALADNTCIYGIFLESGNTNISLEQIWLQSDGNSLSQSAFHLRPDGVNITVKDSIVEGFASSGHGAGMYVQDSNTGLKLLNVTFRNNRASGDGGGVYVSTNCSEMVVAGCSFVGNQATGNGGAVYFSDNSNNLLISDAISYSQMAVIQSLHPYESQYPVVDGVPYMIFNQTYLCQSCNQIIVIFNALTSIYFTEQLYIYDSPSKNKLFFKSTAASNYPGVTGPALTIDSSSIYVEFTGPASNSILILGGYYGFKLYAYPVGGDQMSLSHIGDNSAGFYGGALYFFSNNQFPVFINLKLAQNHAKYSGGGIYFGSTNFGAVIQGCLFESNQADDQGGAMLFSGSHYGVRIYNCSLIDNRALNYAGGVAILNQNGVGLFDDDVIYFGDVLFEDNIAQNGGVFYLSSYNNITLSQCTFRRNQASKGNGGVLYSYSNNFITANRSVFVANAAAVLAGGIYLNYNSILTLVESVFTNNSANKSGGALTIDYRAGCVFIGLNKIQYNQAGFGGGILVTQAGLWSMGKDGSIEIVGNSATRGSALYFVSLLDNGNAMQNISFVGNKARVGGTVFWLRDASMQQEPAGLRDSTVQFVNNSAPYGPVVGTQAIYLIGPRQYMVNDYSQDLSPSLSFNIFDAYYQKIYITGFSTVSVNIDFTKNISCNGFNPYLAGFDKQGLGVTFVKGVATFASLQAYCYPYGQVYLKFQANIGALSGLSLYQSSSYAISNYTQLSFRGCLPGEALSNYVCTPCYYGSYTLVANSTSCKLCGSMVGVDNCIGDQIYLKSGYWRMHPTDEILLTCPFASACIGGNVTGDALCAQGYYGPLCSICAPGYYDSGLGCSSCTGTGFFSLNLIFMIVFVFVIFIFSVLSYLYSRNMIQLRRGKDFFTNEYNEDSDDEMDEMEWKPPNVSTDNSNGQMLREKLPGQGLSEQDPVPPRMDRSTPKPSNDYAQSHDIKDAASARPPKSLFMQIFNEFQLTLRKMMTRIKIIIATLQIVMQSSSTFAIAMPGMFSSFCNSFNFLQLSLSSILPVGCLGSLDFIQSLIMTTLTPIALASLIFFVFLANLWISLKTAHSRIQESEVYNTVKERYLNIFFYLTYFVMPPVSSKIFQMFLCTNIEPGGNAVQDDKYYLTADMNISCSSNYYRAGLYYAIAMVFVYPIGIPLFYFVLLYKNRWIIQRRQKYEGEEHIRPTLENQSQKVDQLGQLSHQGASLHGNKHGSQSGEEENQMESRNPLTEDIEMIEFRKSIDVVDSDDEIDEDEGEFDEDNDDIPGTINGTANSSTNLKPALSVISSKSTVLGQGKIVMPPSAARLAFLWEAYKPERWYWEVVEALRRIVLTSILSVINPGSSDQNVLSILVSFFYIKLYSMYLPYDDVSNDIIAEVGQLQVFFTFFAALVINNSLLSSSFALLIDVLLLLSNLSVCVVSIYYQFILGRMNN